MAKDKKYSGPGKDLGTVKEVYCSGVAITTAGTKIFMANLAKGDRIIEVDGKKQIAPKAVSSTSNKNEDKGNTQSNTSSSSNLEEDEDTESNQME